MTKKIGGFMLLIAAGFLLGRVHAQGLKREQANLRVDPNKALVVTVRNFNKANLAILGQAILKGYQGTLVDEFSRRTVDSNSITIILTTNDVSDGSK